MVNKNKLILIFVIIMCSSISVFSTDIIDMRSDTSSLNNINSHNSEIQLYSNYLNKINKDKFVKSISPYYKNIVVTIDNYSFTIFLNNNGITKIVDGYKLNNDLHIKLTKQNIEYLINNWDKISTFEKIKYIITLDIPIGDMIKISGIAMSIK